MKAYVINLDRSPERLAHFSDQATRAGLAFERLPAVDGRKLDAAERERAISPHFQFQPLNPGEVGIFMSQRAAWQRLVDSGEPMAAVFEDDVVLSAQAGRLLEALSQAGWQADVVKLETTQRPVVLGTPETNLDATHALRPLRSWHGGAAGYVLTRACARRLLDATWPLADPVDQVLFNPMSRICASLNVLQLSPGLCIQKNLLERGHTAESVFGTTIDRHRSRGLLLRHGLAIDLRRAVLKQRGRWRRWRLAQTPGHDLQAVAFDTPAA
jgi:glycosyl transferase family 25